MVQSQPGPIGQSPRESLTLESYDETWVVSYRREGKDGVSVRGSWRETCLVTTGKLQAGLCGDGVLVWVRHVGRKPSSIVSFASSSVIVSLDMVAGLVKEPSNLSNRGKAQ